MFSFEDGNRFVNLRELSSPEVVCFSEDIIRVSFISSYFDNSSTDFAF